MRNDDTHLQAPRSDAFTRRPPTVAAGPSPVRSVGQPGFEFNPTWEDRYWQLHHREQLYADKEHSSYFDFAPAYRVGYMAVARYPDARFEDIEPTLRQEYNASKVNDDLEWQECRPAVRAAWDHARQAA